MAEKYSLKLIYSMSGSIDFFYLLFHIQYSKAGNCCLFGVNNNQTFHVLNFDSPQSLGKKSSIFQSLGI